MAGLSITSARRWAVWTAVLVGVGWCLWAIRNSPLMQMLFLYVGLFTGIDVQNLWDPPVRWHVKQTMTIETPQGDVSSSVVRAKVMRKDRLFKGSPIRETGEALAIEVSPGRYLFAVIEQMKPNELAMLAIPTDERVWEGVPKLTSTKGQPLTVPPDEYPLMVTFGDLTDPKSVQEVDPFNLTATFGPGYKIKSYTVEITDEPVTGGRVEKLLPWLGVLKGRVKPIPEPIPPTYQPSPVETLYSISFLEK